ncbi:hypothetical protein V1478_003320 [Vespula squamosa]|uniref:Uncharacterized protein n=1 Tax=Vespula squamosa TaxID=30214 RepID=A0ABD2BPT8_VESSQ
MGVAEGSKKLKASLPYKGFIHYSKILEETLKRVRLVAANGTSPVRVDDPQKRITRGSTSRDASTIIERFGAIKATLLSRRSTILDSQFFYFSGTPQASLIASLSLLLNNCLYMKLARRNKNVTFLIDLEVFGGKKSGSLKPVENQISQLTKVIIYESDSNLVVVLFYVLSPPLR